MSLMAFHKTFVVIKILKLDSFREKGSYLVLRFDYIRLGSNNHPHSVNASQAAVLRKKHVDLRPK